MVKVNNVSPTTVDVFPYSFTMFILNNVQILLFDAVC